MTVDVIRRIACHKHKQAFEAAPKLHHLPSFRLLVSTCGIRFLMQDSPSSDFARASLSQWDDTSKHIEVRLLALTNADPLFQEASGSG